MKSNQVLSVAEQAVYTLLGLRWRRISNTNSGSRQSVIRNTQSFEFYKEDGAVACTVEFEHTETDEGSFLGCLWGRNGKILDGKGVIIIEDRDLTDTYAKPKEHPLNDLHDLVWNKESGEPVSSQGKFAETIKLEKFTEALRA